VILPILLRLSGAEDIYISIVDRIQLDNDFESVTGPLLVQRHRYSVILDARKDILAVAALSNACSRRDRIFSFDLTNGSAQSCRPESVLKRANRHYEPWLALNPPNVMVSGLSGPMMIDGP
jgi:hypothetical protein